jgi:hypothetical protein
MVVRQGNSSHILNKCVSLRVFHESNSKEEIEMLYRKKGDSWI